MCLDFPCSAKPEDRSPSKSCRRSGVLRHRVRYHLDSSILTLVLAIFILSLNVIFHRDPCVVVGCGCGCVIKFGFDVELKGGKISSLVWSLYPSSFHL